MLSCLLAYDRTCLGAERLPNSRAPAAERALLAHPSADDGLPIQQLPHKNPALITGRGACMQRALLGLALPRACLRSQHDATQHTPLLHTSKMRNTCTISSCAHAPRADPVYGNPTSSRLRLLKHACRELKVIHTISSESTQGHIRHQLPERIDDLIRTQSLLHVYICTRSRERHGATQLHACILQRHASRLTSRATGQARGQVAGLCGSGRLPEPHTGSRSHRSGPIATSPLYDTPVCLPLHTDGRPCSRPVNPQVTHRLKAPSLTPA